MSNLTPIQVIKNTRCIKAIKYSYYDEEMRCEFLDITNKLLDQVCKDKCFRVDGCYTYDMLPRIMQEEDGLKHLILDFNYFDYLIDFLCYCNNPDIKYFKYLFFKYSFEINYKKDELLWSYFCYTYMKKYDIHNVNNINSKIWSDSIIAILFPILHEITHITPDVLGLQQYGDLFKNFADISITFLNFDKRNYDVKEKHCDFIAMYIILLSNLLKKEYNNDNNFIYDLCLKSIIALEFFTFISEININNFVGFNNSAEIVNRLNSMMVMMYVMNYVLKVFDDVDIEKGYSVNVNVLSELINNVCILFNNLNQEIERFNNIKGLNATIEEWKDKLTKEDKETWFCIG